MEIIFFERKSALNGRKIEGTVSRSIVVLLTPSRDEVMSTNGYIRSVAKATRLTKDPRIGRGEKMIPRPKFGYQSPIKDGVSYHHYKKTFSLTFQELFNRGGTLSPCSGECNRGPCNHDAFTSPFFSRYASTTPLDSSIVWCAVSTTISGKSGSS